MKLIKLIPYKISVTDIKSKEKNFFLNQIKKWTKDSWNYLNCNDLHCLFSKCSYKIAKSNLLGKQHKWWKCRIKKVNFYVDDSKWIKSDVKTSKKIKGKKKYPIELTKYGFTQHLAQSHRNILYMCINPAFPFFFLWYNLSYPRCIMEGCGGCGCEECACSRWYFSPFGFLYRFSQSG
jgi:hypothetical protein